jgi:hypothetical protein
MIVLVCQGDVHKHGDQEPERCCLNSGQHPQTMPQTRYLLHLLAESKSTEMCL